MKKTIDSSNKPASGLTRREFATTALAVPAAMALVGSSHSLAQSQNVAVRKEASSLDEAELQVFKDAMQILRERPASDPTSWDAQAAFHKDFCSNTDAVRQIHFGWWFLPWHRAYLRTLEMKLQAAVNEPQLALPYWDWVANPRIPAAYMGEGEAGGSNPLMAGDSNPLSDPDRWAPADQDMPEDLRDVNAPLRAQTFSLFGGDPLIDVRVPSRPGLMESPHNTAHYWAGGKLADFATTSYDPLFYALHANIDRVWDVWVRLPSSLGNPTDPEWLDKKWTSLTDENGLPIEISIKDLVDTEAFGFIYDNVKPPSEIAQALTGTGPEVAGAISINSPTDNNPNVLISEPLTKRLTAREQSPIIKAMAAEKPKSVVLELVALEVPQGLPTIYRFFLNRPDADAFTAPDAAEGYLGNAVLVPLAGDEVQPRLDLRVMLPEGAINDIAAQDENSVTIVPAGIDVPPLGLKGPKAPEVRIDFERVALLIGE